jgi:DNA modification methylase
VRHRRKPRSIETCSHIAKSAAKSLPSWQVEMMPLDEIKPADRNAHTHTRRQVRQVAGSMKQFGTINPIIVDNEGRLVAGHARYEAAKLLGLTHVPAIRLSHLSRAELRAYALADNKHELHEIGLDIGITGFEPFEIDALLGDLGGEVPDPADEAIEPHPGPAVSYYGDLFLLGEHRLLVGDARERKNFRRLLEKSRARMAVLDPPYNVKVQGHVGGRGRTKHPEFKCASGELTSADYTRFLEQALTLCSAHSLDGSIHFVFMDWRHIDELSAAGKAAYDELKNICVWAKTTPGQGTFYRSQHELIFVFKRGQAPHLNNFELGQHGRTRSNVWQYAGVNTFRAGRMDELRMHPTVKPIALIVDAMRDVSRRGDIVLDVFAGSGTTIMAAERIGRRAFCMEIDPTYVDVTIERWQRFTRRDAVLEATGETFDELKVRRGRSS